MDSDSDEEMVICAIENSRMIVMAAAMCVVGQDLFRQFHEEDQKYVDHYNGVRNVPSQISVSPSLFRSITNFKPGEFEESSGFVQNWSGTQGLQVKRQDQQQVVDVNYQLSNDF
ncbi:hypothetical protein R1flu_010732 [Riccia fluitans]|uniref:Uncharacterized protein n=1 Tax=Riccia fluitans TaxID=41844 RepID=A0ABD1Z6J9_9MARC